MQYDSVEQMDFLNILSLQVIRIYTRGYPADKLSRKLINDKGTLENCSLVLNNDNH